MVELAGIGPVPFAAMMLADLGAEVVRIDRPGDVGSSAVPADQDILRRGRPSVVLDLKSARGPETVLRLIDRADILLEGFRPGVTERLGLGPRDCLGRRPALVYGRMTGWGQHGPLAESAGHDINYLSVAGGLDPIGRAGGPPQVPLNLLGDFGGGALYLVAGVLAALTHARATGEGQVVDAAITDGVAHLLSMVVAMQQAGSWSAARGTNLLDTGAPFYDVYETSDGRWMSVGALEPSFWSIVESTLARHGVQGLPDRDDPAQWPRLRTQLAEVFAGRTQAEWIEIFTGADACVTPVVPLDEAPEHPHNQARGSYFEHEGMVQPAPAPRFSATPPTLTTAPSRPGAQTRQALSEWGIDDVDTLLVDGTAVQT